MSDDDLVEESRADIGARRLLICGPPQVKFRDDLARDKVAKAWEKFSAANLGMSRKKIRQQM